MGVFSRWFREERRYRECRHCGTELGPDDEACPACGSTSISVYRLP